MLPWFVAACRPPEADPALAPSPAPADRRVPLAQPLPCAPGHEDPGCAREEAARLGLERAVGWLVAAVRDPALPLNLDGIIALHPVTARWASPALDEALAGLSGRLDRPGDPRRRLWDPTARLAEDPSAWWEATPGGEAHPSQILVEALYCAEHGMRPSTVRWLCDDFRDQGGPKSAHAAWYLALAVDAGCVPREATCLDALRDELVGASRGDPPPTTTAERDRLGEQVVFGRIAGAAAADLAPAVDRLLAAQRADGAFAVDGAPTDRAALHATLVGAWALATWSDAP